VAGEINRVRRTHGNSTIKGGSQGWSSAGIFHEARAPLHRSLAASLRHQVMNYSFGAALAFLPHILGNPQAVTGPLTRMSVSCTPPAAGCGRRRGQHQPDLRRSAQRPSRHQWATGHSHSASRGGQGGGLDCRVKLGNDIEQMSSEPARKARQAGAMPRRPINGFATTSLSSTIFSGSAAKPRVVGPSMIAAPSRGLYFEL
jgi:hypothetical protein